jgi:MFS family permease
VRNRHARLVTVPADDLPPTGGLWRGGFGRLFAADAISSTGRAMSSLALQLLLVTTMQATPEQLGIVRGAQWAPYLVFGLVAGVVVDRVRRRPVLIASDVASTLTWGAIAALAFTGRLTVPVLVGLVFLAGSITCFEVAAWQSYVPRLVPDPLLPAAFARLEQMGSVITAAGPLGAGALVRLVGAPIALAVDALTYAVSMVLLLTIRRAEPVRVRARASADTSVDTSAAPDRHLGRELREGATWVYGHPMIRPYALWLHTWFFFSNLGIPVVVFFASDELGLGPVAIGAVFAAAGVVGMAVAGSAPRLERRHGVGRVFAATEWFASPLAWAVIALTPTGWWAIPVLALGHGLTGLSTLTAGLGMSYRSVVTPDPLRARMNATIRTVNWGSIAVAAPLGGWIAHSFGNRTALGVAAAGLLAATAYLAQSPFRTARMPS